MADLLKTDYKDDVLNAEVNPLRKYQIITNEDGTVSFVDVTEYSQVGDSFGGADINSTNEAINKIDKKVDVSDISFHNWSYEDGKLIKMMVGDGTGFNTDYAIKMLRDNQDEIVAAANESNEVTSADITIDTTKLNPVSTCIVEKLGSNMLRVTLRVTVKKQFTSSTFEQIGTLPEGFRPSRNIIKQISFGSQNAIFAIWENGKIDIASVTGEVSTSSWIYIDETFIF